MDTCLSDGCTAGVFGDGRAWARTLGAYRDGLRSSRRSPAEAGNLGVLLLLAGRGDRGLEVFSMLDELAPGSTMYLHSSGRATPGANSDAQGFDGPDDSGAFGFPNQDREPHLLAALVLSGQWARAHRCCERMVLWGVSGSNGVAKEPSFLRA